MSRFVALSLALLTLALAPAAAAQERFGHAGGFAIGAERITGFTSTDTEADIEATGISEELDTETTSIAFLANDPATPFAIPRVGFDFFVIDGLSLGGFFGYMSSETESSFGNVDTDESNDLILFGARIGYAFMFSDVVGIWPRGGFSYLGVDIENEDGDQTEFSVFALSAEAMLVIAPVEHAAILLGPTMDFTVSGEGDVSGAVDADLEDVKVNTFGLQAGVALWF
jgi:hypothetical protein